MDPSSEPSSKPGWLERLISFFSREPHDREELVETLHSAFERQLLDSDALTMIEGALQVSDLQARDIMVPRSQMDVIDIDDSPETLLPFVIDTAHSRFPVIKGNKDNILGILLAKDLLRYYAGTALNITDMLRPAIFIPESKRLNILLKEFRHKRNHMAIVVDEYGGTAGLVTIEDVMEQIVGEIEDEYDFDEAEDNIVEDAEGNWRIKAITPIEDLNQTIGSHFVGEDFHTVGGLVLSLFGYVPKRGEEISAQGYQFRILRSDSRSVQTILLSPLSSVAGDAGE
jgi:magnesium and cobalt transporter